MDLTNIQRRVFASIRGALSHEDKTALVAQLAEELGVEPVKAELSAVKHGDTVQTDLGPAVAILVPDNLLRGAR